MVDPKIEDKKIMRKLEMIKILVHFIRCSLKKILDHSKYCGGEIHLHMANVRCTSPGVSVIRVIKQEKDGM